MRTASLDAKVIWTLVSGGCSTQVISGNGHNVGTLISAATQEELLQFTGEKPPPQPVVLVLSPVLLTRYLDPVDKGK